MINFMFKKPKISILSNKIFCYIEFFISFVNKFFQNFSFFDIADMAVRYTLCAHWIFTGPFLSPVAQNLATWQQWKGLLPGHEPYGLLPGLLQLLVAVCLFLASKFKENMHIPSEKLVKNLDFIVSLEIREWELIVLHRLKWDLCSISCSDF